MTNTAGSTYAWTVTGGVQTGGTNSNSITVDWGTAGAGNVQVVETNTAGCPGAPVNLAVTINAIPATSAITGDIAVCANETGIIYSVTNTAGSTYAWTVTGGVQTGGTNSNSITVDWGTAGAGNVQVVETNAAGCPGAPVNLAVTINAIPATSAITGDIAVCANETGIIYSVTNTAGSTYAWTVTGGVQTGGTNSNSITVDWGTAGAGNVQVVETNTAGCPGAPVNLAVTINALPTTSAITGDIAVCANETGIIYSVTNTAGSTYAWTVTGGVQTGGTNSNSITVDWGTAGAGNVQVVETNAAGCPGAPVNLAVTINALPATSAITGDIAVCANEAGIIYSVTNTAGSTYAWTVTGGVQTGGTNSNSITVDWGTAGAGNVQVVETNAAGCPGAPVNLAVTINAIPATSAVTGDIAVCANETGIIYSVTNTAGSTYAWTVTGGVQTGGTNSNSITVDWGTAGAGNVQVVETNAAGCPGAPVNLAVTINAIPATSAVTGDIAVCANETGIIYSVTNTAGSTYAWTVTGGVQTGGTNSSSITVTWGTAGAGNVQVVETNAAGCPGAPVNLAVTINALPTTSAITGDIAVCANETGIIYSVTNTAGSTYAWTVTGGVQTGGTNSSSITVTWGTAGAGNVQVVETNAAGCPGAPVNLAVTINAIPTASMTGATTICVGSSATLQMVFTGTGPWTFEYSDGVTTIAGNSAVSPFDLLVSPSATTTYTLVSVTDANCVGTIIGLPAIDYSGKSSLHRFNSFCNSQSCVFRSIEFNRSGKL